MLLKNFNCLNISNNHNQDYEKKSPRLTTGRFSTQYRFNVLFKAF